MERKNKSVDKIVSGGQLSMRDEVLTPAEKMEAERRRMGRPDRQPATDRHEEDQQRASLGGPVLTPQRKMDMARQEARLEARPQPKAKTENNR